MKNNRTAAQQKNAREAYRALVAAHTAGKALATIGSNQAARKTISSIREEARQELQLADHYTNTVTEDDRTTWCAENSNGEPFCLDTDCEWAFEALSFYLHNNLGEFVHFEYKASYHIGHEYDNSLEFKASHYATDDDGEKRTLSAVSAYKSARRYADRLARQSFEERARGEYGRRGITELYDEWQLNRYVEQDRDGYTVVFEYDGSGEELLRVEYSDEGYYCNAENGDGEQVTPTEDERSLAKDTLVEYLEEALNQVKRHA